MTYKLIEATDSWMTRPKVGLPHGAHFYPSEASVKYTDHHGLERVAGTCLRAAWYRVSGLGQASGTDAYSEWIFSLGKAVETILVEQWKQMGVWVANNVKFYDQARNISGELDVVLREPETGRLYGVEVKSFYGYNATKDICGNKHVIGKPKTSQLLQTLIYVDHCKTAGLCDYFKMIYYARDSAKRAEFNIELVDDNGFLRPSINGVIDYRFTMQDIYDRFAQLQDYVNSGAMPPRDYEKAYSNEKVELYRAAGEISDTAYKDWQRNPTKNPIGNWNCSYCPFRSQCWSNSNYGVGNVDIE